MEYSYNKKSIWKWMFLYVVVGAVVYGLIYYFFFYNKGGYSDNSQYPINNSQNDTADWKTYTNDKYGFEFSYPNKVTIQQDGDAIMVYDTRWGYDFNWTMKLYSNGNKMSLEDWILYQFNSFSQKSDKDCKIVSADTYGQKVIIKNAYTVLVDAPSYGALCNHVGFYTLSPNKFTVVEFDLVQPSPDLYQGILSTFKFTQ